MAVKPIPEGYHTVTPYLTVKDPAAAMEFYKKAFGAVEMLSMKGPDGSIMHAEIKIGDSPIMFGAECPIAGAKSAETLGGTPVGLCLYVEDVDTRFKQAVGAGAKAVRPVMDQFYGDRSGTVTDPFGHQWTIATHKEDLTEEQMHERAQAWMSKQASA